MSHEVFMSHASMRHVPFICVYLCMQGNAEKSWKESSKKEEEEAEDSGDESDASFASQVQICVYMYICVLNIHIYDMNVYIHVYMYTCVLNIHIWYECMMYIYTYTCWVHTNVELRREGRGQQ